ncbi:MAG: tetratricopeptide repeat protein [Bdellovibrionales bacterium]|nr:tetratricopeptide repeat protein [Bdellovibrionales bacterium]
MRIIIILFLLYSSFSSWSQEEDVDYMAVTAIMLKNNYYDRARSSLEKIKIDEEDIDLHKYYAYWGLVYISEKKYPEALLNLENSLKFYFEDTEVYLYLAEVQFQLEHYNEALKSLEKTSQEVRNKYTYTLLISKVYWELGNKSKAYNFLEEVKSPSVQIKKQMWSRLVESLLFQQSYDFLLKNWKIWDQQSLLTFAAIYKKEKQNDLALEVLERMRWEFPNSADVVLELAQTYLYKKMKFSAAMVLEESARSIPSLAYEASMMLRDMGFAYRALNLNLAVQDEGKALKNRLSIYLELEKYTLVSKLEPILEQKGLLSDEELRYAVAFAHYKTGAFKRSQTLLNQLTRDDLFKKAVEIKKLISTCKDQEWSCLETL